MPDYLLILFLVLGVAVVAVAIAWFVMTQPSGQAHVRVDFDQHKDRELSTRFISKKR